jgi:glycosyltransferase involved in cell wall biosynthesis
MERITVFTPTFNRSGLLDRCYKSLKRQTCKQFIWLIIDDGSIDDTKEIVNNWINNEENDFEIKYLYKTNGGLYSAYIAAINNIDTELCVCVDSDDYLTDTAIEDILQFWDKNGSSDYAGIIGLDALANGNIIGCEFPDDLKTINLVDTMIGVGPIKDVDWKNVVRTDLYRKAIPSKKVTDSFANEKDFNPHYLHIKICNDYDFLALNKVLCIVDYQPDGMTATVFKQYLRSPNSFRIMRLLSLSYRDAPLLYRCKTAIHYVSSCVLSKKPCVSDSPQKFLTLMMFPLGIIWTLFLKMKNYND